jgi:hypothetical protein
LNTALRKTNSLRFWSLLGLALALASAVETSIGCKLPFQQKK